MKYIVSMAVDCRLDVTVEANSPDEAFEAAKTEFMDADLSKADIVDAGPVNCSDAETGELIKDYNG